MKKTWLEQGSGAYPMAGGDGDRYDTELGMSLRDYFAAKAMQAMITKSDGQSRTGGAKGVPLIAKFSYEFADAMLAARDL